MGMISQLGSRTCRLLALGAFGLALVLPASGQCVMCRESAKYQRAEGLEALNRGILILAVPPVVIALGIGWVTYRHRNSTQPVPPKENTPPTL